MQPYSADSAFENAVTGANNIASSLDGEKGQNKSKNNSKQCNNDFTHGRIIL